MTTINPSEIVAYVHRGQLYIAANTTQAVCALESTFPRGTWVEDTDYRPLYWTGIKIREEQIELMTGEGER